MAEPPPDSALARLMAAHHGPAGRAAGLTLVERPGLQIWQIAAWHADGFAALRPLLAVHLGCPAPERPDQATTGAGLTVFWTAPRRWLIVVDRPAGELASGTAQSDTSSETTEAVSANETSLCGPLSELTDGRAALTDLGHARTILRLAGQEARTVLAKLCRIDLHPAAFPPGYAAQTTLATHVTALIHAVQYPADAREGSAATTFDLFLPRSYARSATETLLDAAAEFGIDCVTAAS